MICQAPSPAAELTHAWVLGGCLLCFRRQFSQLRLVCDPLRLLAVLCAGLLGCARPAALQICCTLSPTNPLTAATCSQSMSGESRNVLSEILPLEGEDPTSSLSFKAADCSWGRLLRCQAVGLGSCTQVAVVCAVNGLNCAQPCPNASQCCFQQN